MNDNKKRKVNFKDHIKYIGNSPNKFKPKVTAPGRFNLTFYNSTGNIELDAKIIHRKKRDGD